MSRDHKELTPEIAAFRLKVLALPYDDFLDLTVAFTGDANQKEYGMARMYFCFAGYYQVPLHQIKLGHALSPYTYHDVDNLRWAIEYGGLGPDSPRLLWDAYHLVKHCPRLANWDAETVREFGPLLNELLAQQSTADAVGESSAIAVDTRDQPRKRRQKIRPRALVEQTLMALYKESLNSESLRECLIQIATQATSSGHDRYIPLLRNQVPLTYWAGIGWRDWDHFRDCLYDDTSKDFPDRSQYLAKRLAEIIASDGQQRVSNLAIAISPYLPLSREGENKETD